MNENAQRDPRQERLDLFVQEREERKKIVQERERRTRLAAQEAASTVVSNIVISVNTPSSSSSDCSF